MFLKSYKIRNKASLKTSEVKKLRQRIQAEFSNTNLELLMPSKSNINMLKIVTHSNFQTNVYCADKIPMFFENEDNKLVPTLYSLWIVPDMLPSFTTHAVVFAELSNGADLTLPGVIPQGIGMNRGQLVAVNLTCNKSAIGVGYLPRSSDDLYMSGVNGIAVKILHLFGDKLWGHEPSLAKQLPQNKSIKLNEFEPEVKGESNDLEKNEQSIAEINIQLEMADILNSEVVSTENFDENKDLGNHDENCQVTPELLLKRAFLSALKNNGRNLQLPLLTSNFYRLYVVPESDEALDLKKTKYKKLSNFLNEMINQGFVVVQKETKLVDKITSINLEHPEIVNFITDLNKNNSSLHGSSGIPLFHPELTELYIITDITAPVFTKLNYKRGSGIPPSQIKKVIRKYINKQNLLMSKDPKDEYKSFILDECLEKLCNTKVASLSRITNAVISQMDHSYQMCTPNDFKKKKPLIQMSLATRSGNKKVTLVNNIECYGIILSEFIKLCKQGAAASTTTATLPNLNRKMVQIQGNQVRFVYNLLTETYKIPSKCILGLELAKYGKKHKKTQRKVIKKRKKVKEMFLLKKNLRHWEILPPYTVIRKSFKKKDLLGGHTFNF